MQKHHGRPAWGDGTACGGGVGWAVRRGAGCPRHQESFTCLGDTDCTGVKSAAPWSWWGKAQACPTPMMARSTIASPSAADSGRTYRQYPSTIPAAWTTGSNLKCLLRHRFGSKTVSGSKAGAVVGAQAHYVRERGLCRQSGHLDSELAKCAPRSVRGEAPKEPLRDAGAQERPAGLPARTWAAEHCCSLMA